MPAQVWLARVLEHWGLMWPQVRGRLEVANDMANETAENLPLLVDDPALEAVLVVLLNNAAQVSPDAVVLRVSCVDQALSLEVMDGGGGLESGKAEGWGVGLELARAALDRMGGVLQIGESEMGGVSARVTLPLAVVQGV
jgi:K+-sensing histidine kinase KdpD